eukprot:TRINITY_DN22_c0_g1_i1.p2 TRINITY_DN22_c0_g1~~TRINITY_DN22_c0_g1_i1.p2  ORF type:complete len:102 (+),score=2.76 TRINITY_DN22_c0_g1_i1:946-1251(+)
MPFGATQRRLRRRLPNQARVNGGSNSDSLKVPLRGEKVVVTCTSPSFREPSSELGPCCSGKSNLGGGSGLLAVRFLRHAVRCHSEETQTETAQSSAGKRRE